MESEDIFEQSPHFAPFFRSLQKVISENVPIEETRTTAAASPLVGPPPETSSIEVQSLPSLSNVHNLAISESSSPSRKHPNSLTSSPSASPTKVCPTSSPISKLDLNTPDRPPPTSKPEFTGEPSERCQEDNPRKVIELFVDTIVSLFENDIGKVGWVKCSPHYRLSADGS